MRFLTADEVAGVLRCSREHVYRNYRLFAGVKIGRVLRFEEERLYSTLGRMADDSLQVPREVEVPLHQEHDPAYEGGVRHEAGRKERRDRCTAAGRNDKYGLYREINRLRWDDVHDDYVILRTRKAKNSDLTERKIPLTKTAQ